MQPIHENPRAVPRIVTLISVEYQSDVAASEFTRVPCRKKPNTLMVYEFDTKIYTYC